MTSLLLAILLQSAPTGTNGYVTFKSGEAFRDSSVYMLFASPMHTNVFVIENEGTNVVEIMRDGSVKLSAPPDAAAKVFWDAVQRLAAASFAYQNRTNEIMEVLKEAHRWLSPDPTSFQLVYKTPATRLREEADAIEAREKFMLRLSTLIDKLSKP